MNASVWDGTSASGFAGGDGSVNNPYLISTAQQFAYFRDTFYSGTTYAGKYIELTTDIDFDNRGFSQIGYGGFDSNGSTINSRSITFQGHFDGKDHAISKLNLIGHTSTTFGPRVPIGLFSIAQNATICNLHFVGAGQTINHAWDIAGDMYHEYFGTLVGAAVNSQLYNLSVSNINISGGDLPVSNIFGVGGIVGCIYGGSIYDCYAGYINISSIFCTNTAGGVCGRMTDVERVESITASNITCEADYAGGVVGECFVLTDTVVRDLHATDCSIIGLTAGGIVGFIQGTNISDFSVENTVITSAQDAVSDRVEGYDEMTTSYSYSLGGAIGYADKILATDKPVITNIQCTDCSIIDDETDYWETTYEEDGEEYSDSYCDTASLGGVVGGSDHSLENCYSNTDIEYSCGDVNVGGVVGDCYGYIRECSFTGTIKPYVTGDDEWSWLYIGGVAGGNCVNTGEISRCYVDADIVLDGQQNRIFNGIAYECSQVNNNLVQGHYTCGTTSSYIEVFNFVTSASNNMSNNIFNAIVDTSLYSRGVGGFNSTNGANNYYNSDLTPPTKLNSNSRYGNKTSTELKTRSTYDATNWSTFDEHWLLSSSVNDGYPMLKAHKPSDPVEGFEGEGTQESPYLINDEYDFEAMHDQYNTKDLAPGLYWSITAEELDVESLYLNPIGTKERPFTGHLLGNRCSIYVWPSINNGTYYGVFGYVAANASIEWLAIYGDIDWYITTDHPTYIGGLAGYVEEGAIISNCYFKGSFTCYMETSGTAFRNEPQSYGLIGNVLSKGIVASYAIIDWSRDAYDLVSKKLSSMYNHIEAVYGTNSGTTVGDMKAQSTYTQFGFVFSDSAWKMDIQNDGYPYFKLNSFNTSAFYITRSITGSGAISVTVDGASVAFSNDKSTIPYNRGVKVTVEITAASGYATKSINIGGTNYSSHTNKTSVVIRDISTQLWSGDFAINVVFTTRYSLTISNGTNPSHGSVGATGTYVTDATSPYRAITGTSMTATINATTNTSALKAYISSVTIDGTTINISSADTTTTTHTIGGIKYTITRTKTTGFSSTIVTKVVITFTMTKNVSIVANYSAQQTISTSVTLVGGDGNTTSTPTGTITADWGSTTNTLTKTEQTGKTFIGWVVNGQIESQEDTFSTQVTSSTTTITELWAVMYNISLTLPSGIESIQVTHMLTGLSYNITGATTLMAGDWIVKVPTGKTLKLNGTTVSPDSQGRYIVSITGNGTISLA
ncbi:MAG: GLUG motif-containing protein [Clostridia bacterium]